MPMLNLVSIKCIKRSDDGLQSKDEPYFSIKSDSGDEYTVQPSRGLKHDISKGEKITEFTRDNIRFEVTCDVTLYESDSQKIGLHSKDEKIGKFTARKAHLGDGVIKKTLKDGNDAHYEVRYKVEESPEERAEEGVEDAVGQIEDKIDDVVGGIGDRAPQVGGGGGATIVRLFLTELARGDDTQGRRSDVTGLRLYVNGTLMVNDATLREGDSAIHGTQSRTVSSPLNLWLEEKVGPASWVRVATIDERWSSSPTETNHVNRLTTDDGHVYTMQWHLEEQARDTSRTAAKAPAGGPSRHTAPRTQGSPTRTPGMKIKR